MGAVKKDVPKAEKKINVSEKKMELPKNLQEITKSITDYIESDEGQEAFENLKEFSGNAMKMAGEAGMNAIKEITIKPLGQALKDAKAERAKAKKEEQEE